MREIYYLKKSIIMILTLIAGFHLTACRKNQSAIPQNYFRVDRDYNIEQITEVDKIFRLENNIYARGKNIAQKSYVETLEMVNIVSKETIKINNDLLNKIDGQITGVFFLKDNFWISYNDANRDNKITVFNGENYEIIRTIEYSENKVLSEIYLDNENQIRMLFSASSEYGTAISELIYNADTFELTGQREWGFIESLYTKVFLNDTYDGYLCVDSIENDDSVSFLIKKTDFNGNEIYAEEVSFTDESVKSVFMNKNGNVCIMTKNDNNEDEYYVVEYSKEDGSVKETFTFESMDFIQVFNIYSEKYDFIYLSRDGVYGYNFEEDISEKILSTETMDGNFHYQLISLGDNILVLYSDIPVSEEQHETILKLDKNGETIDNVSFKPSSQEKNIVASTVLSEDLYCYMESDGNGLSYDVYICDNIENIDFAFRIEDMISVFEIYADSDGNICVSGLDGSGKNVIRVYNHTGKCLTVINSDKNIYPVSHAVTQDGFCMYGYNESGDVELLKYNKSEKNFETVDNLNVRLDEIEELYNGDDKYVFYYQTCDGIYGYSHTGDCIEVANWINSDIYMKVQSLCLAENGDMIAYAKDYKDNKSRFIRFLKADENELRKINQKKIITVAGYGLIDSDFYDIVRKYNSSNIEYHIRLIDYSILNEENIFDGFREAIASKEIPDIVINDAEHNFNDSFSENLFENIYEYVNKMQGDVYFDNILNIYQSEKGLYAVPVSFDVVSLVTDPNLELNDNEDNAVISFLKNKMGKYDGNQEKMIEDLIVTNLCAYIDFENDLCCFDSNEFCELLSLIRAYDESSVVSDTLLGLNSICDYDNIVRYEYDMCYTPEFLGFSSEGLYYDLVKSDMSVSISASSEHKDESWNIIELLLDEEYQKNIEKGYPVMKSIFYSDAFEDYDRLLEMYGGYIKNSNGDYVELDTMKKSYLEYLFKRIENVSKYKINNIFVNQIVSDEIDEIIHGNLKIEEIAKRLQNKMQMYLNEIN